MSGEIPREGLENPKMSKISEYLNTSENAVIDAITATETGIEGQDVLAFRMMDGVNAVRHGRMPSVESETRRYHDGVECFETRHILTVRDWSGIDEFESGDNGSIWASGFCWYKQQIPGVRWHRIRRELFRRYLRKIEPYSAAMCRRIEWADVSACYRLGINPLPRMREVCPGTDFKFSPVSESVKVMRHWLPGIRTGGKYNMFNACFRVHVPGGVVECRPK